MSPQDGMFDIFSSTFFLTFFIFLERSSLTRHAVEVNWQNRHVKKKRYAPARRPSPSFSLSYYRTSPFRDIENLNFFNVSKFKEYQKNIPDFLF